MAVIKEERSIIPEMAILIENDMQIPAKFRINKQESYNEYLTRKKQKSH